MRKHLVSLFVLLMICSVMFSCSQNIEFNDVNDKVKAVESLQNDFRKNLKTAISEMQDEAIPLLKSIVFNEKDLSNAVKKGGVSLDDDILNDDEIFENLSEENQLQIQRIAEAYFEEVQNLAKSITVFDKGLPEGIEETDLFVKYAGVEYSKCVLETLEMAYQIRDELYNGSTTKGAKLRITPRWDLNGSHLGAIYYSYRSNFSKEEKEAIRYAMDEWERATDGAVKFYEQPLGFFGMIKWALGAVRNIRIDKVKGQSYSGLTMPGNMPWSFMHLNVDYMFRLSKGETPDVWKLKSSYTHKTLIHEIGHAIGLQHEFERSDRDKYIEPVGSSLPGPCGFLRWIQKLNINNYGSFDYKSCMNYAGDYYIKGTKRSIDFDDINEISYNDALTVKYIYSRITYSEMRLKWQDTRPLLLRGN